MRTLIIVKPDAVKRGLVGRILSRFEEKEIAVKGLKMINVSKADAEKLYEAHKGKPFYNDLMAYITSSKVVVCVLEANEIVKIVRKMIGSTNPSDAEPGTIRGDFGLEINKNIIHASDSTESANREIPIFFKENEII